MNLDDLPHDADGDAIRRLVDDGSDLSKPMKIDFFVAVPNEEAGRAFARVAENNSFAVELEHDEEDDAWTCYCSREMLADYNEIIAIQTQLDELSAPFEGFADGWGSFGNKES